MAILIVGMGAGGILYSRSVQSEVVEDDDALYDSRKNIRETEKLTGKFGVLTAEWTQSISKLCEPRPLAISVCVVSVFAAGGCFVMASRTDSNY